MLLIFFHRWDNRSKEILDNITSFEADFICLQEVDEYISFFDRNMEAHGYTGIYFPRGEGYKRDGCAIFFKPKLKPDEWDDVKLAQAKSLMFRLAMFKRTISAVENCSPSVSLLVTSIRTPRVYAYLNSDNIPIVWPLGGEEEDTEFGLCSAYGFTKGEPKFTKYVPGFAKTLDYVLFTPSDFISPMKLLDSPDVVDFLPNKVTRVIIYPSALSFRSTKTYCYNYNIFL
ncbi:putative poly(A)-specific ribonuclease [Arabidopsis thaliana]